MEIDAEAETNIHLFSIAFAKGKAIYLFYICPLDVKLSNEKNDITYSEVY